jgi:ABC-type transport system involved in cytochrome bd biosynthesis fused ATPase/permease subunit
VAALVLLPTAAMARVVALDAAVAGAAHGRTLSVATENPMPEGLRQDIDVPGFGVSVGQSQRPLLAGCRCRGRAFERPGAARADISA